MIKKIAVSMAALLLIGFAMPVSANSSAIIELSENTISVEFATMTPQTTAMLIEQYATQNWNLSVEEAWSAYDTGTLTIDEIVPDREYKVKYDGGELVVIFEGH